MEFMMLISCLIADVQTLTGTAIAVGAVLTAIGMMLIYLLGRFIKSYDDRIAATKTEFSEYKTTMTAAYNKLSGEMEKIKDSIAFNVGEREKQFAAMDRKIYDGNIQQIERHREFERLLREQDEKLDQLKYLTLNEKK